MASRRAIAITDTKASDQDIPEQWDRVPFSDVIIESTSGDWGKDHPSNESMVAARVIRGTDFPRARRGQIDGAPVRYLQRPSIEKRRLAPGELLVELSGGSRDQPTGRVLLASMTLLDRESPIAFSNFVKRLRLDGVRVDPQFVEYFWSNLYRQGRTRPYEKRTTGIRNFKLTDFLENEHILLPPILEQRAIATVLKGIQQAKEATEGVVGATRELRRSLTRHLFTYGQTPVKSTKDVELQETAIGPMPNHWAVIRFRDVLSQPLRNGHSARRVSSGDGVRTLTLSAVTYDDFSLANTKVTEADPDRVSHLWLRRGDILIERANTRELVGTAALYEGLDDFAIYPDLVIRARVQQSVINPQFVVEFLRTPVVRAYFQRNARGAAGNMPKIGHGIIEELRVPLPPLDEQIAIAQIIESIDRKCSAEAARVAALEQFLTTLMGELMTGKRRVVSLEAAHG